MEKDDILFLRHISDKDSLCFGKNIITSTGFLDAHQQSLVFEHKSEFKSPFVLWGGYEDAERRVLFFLPDYLEEVPKEELSVIKAEFAKGCKLAHKDFLGSALGLGIKRENTGDILIGDGFAQIFILPKLEDFFLTNYTNAGRQTLSCSAVSTDEVVLPKVNTESKTTTLASMRGDCIVSAIFSIPRSKANELIEKGRVFVNDIPFLKPDRPLGRGDKVKVTKSGRAIIEEIGGTSRKGRIFVTFKIYQ